MFAIMPNGKFLYCSEGYAQFLLGSTIAQSNIIIFW